MFSHHISNSHSAEVAPIRQQASLRSSWYSQTHCLFTRFHWYSCFCLPWGWLGPHRKAGYVLGMSILLVNDKPPSDHIGSASRALSTVALQKNKHGNARLPLVLSPRELRRDAVHKRRMKAINGPLPGRGKSRVAPRPRRDQILLSSNPSLQ